MPAHRPDYLAAALRDKRVRTRNPYNANQVREVSLAPGDVDGIVLWSKDPRALLEPQLLGALAPYAFYVQYTLNAYGRDIEPGVPALKDRLDAYRRLADAHGKERVRWRYDPILMTPAWTIERHGEAFGGIARELCGYASSCTISFMDVYRRIQKAMVRLAMRPPDEEEMRAIAASFARAAGEYGIALGTCAEAGDYADLGILPASCVDAELLMRIAGRGFPSEKDPNQRPHCGCARSVDIGSYGACPHACAYCYARRG